MYGRPARLAIALVITLSMIVTVVYITEDSPADPTTNYSEAIEVISRSDELDRQKALQRQEDLQRQVDRSAKLAMEIEDRLKCLQATPGTADVDVSFSAAADSISAKIKQDDLIEACIEAKGWPKK